jgi:LEA14-like dessication related protein
MRLNRVLFLAIFSLMGGLISAQSIHINELVARNNAGAMDDFFQTDDWVELYNFGGLLNLGGYYLSDDPLDLTKWQIPTNDPGVTTVLPNDHIIFWMDRDPEQGADHVDFTLTGDGETVLLVAPDGVTIIDQITYPIMATNISYGRTCDTCDDWVYFDTPTFNAPNANSAQTTELIVFNEVQTANISTITDAQYEFAPWIELYNPNDFQVNLRNYTLRVNGVDHTLDDTNPFYTVIPANGFLLLWMDNDLADGPHHMPQSISNGQTLAFIGPDGSVLDTYTTGNVQPGQSHGRITDGNVNSTTFNTPTPRISNTTVAVPFPTLYINEVMPSNIDVVADNFGNFDDWFEIYNPNNFDVDLSGYYFTDNPEVPTKWLVPGSFPDSVTVGANDFLLFWADEEVLEGVLHASFQLNSISECLSFYSPDGFSRIDQICWSNIADNSSYGRTDDGASTWWTFTTSTPENSNGNGVLSVSESISSNDLGVFYPNPTQQMLNCSKEFSGTLFSMTGQAVLAVQKGFSVDLSGLSAGLYTLRLQNGGSVLIQKN